MIQSSKLIDLAKSTIISSVLDILNVNYSVIDPDGRYIAQNKSMKKAISKGLINAERNDLQASFSFIIFLRHIQYVTHRI